MTDLELHHHDASGASRRDLASRTGPTVVLLLLAIATLLIGGYGWFLMISLIDATGWATMGEMQGQFLSVFAIGGGLPCLLFAIRTLAAGPTRPLTVGVAWFAAAVGAVSTIGSVAGLVGLRGVIGEEINAGRIWTMVFLAGWPVGGAAITVALFAWQSKRSPIWIICSLLMTAIIATLYVIEFVRFANGATL